MHSFRDMVGIAAFFLMGAMLWPLSAAAEGAIAVADMGTEGFSIGYAMNWGSFAVARREALKRCRSFAVSDEIRARCAIVSDIHRQCVAMVKRGESESGFGWGIDPSLDNARQKAMDMCQSMPGANSGDPCIIVIEDPFNACDQSDR